MGKPYIVLGDSTSSGGKVIEGSPYSTIEGKPMARVGDHVTCPVNGHGGVTTIITGDPCHIIDGKPAARHGDSCACGCKLIASQGLVMADTGGGGGSAKNTLAKAATAKPATEPTPEQLEHEYNDFYVLKDGKGKPLKSAQYAVEFPDGRIEYGVTDSNGHSNLHVTDDEAKDLSIYAQGA